MRFRSHHRIARRGRSDSYEWEIQISAVTAFLGVLVALVVVEMEEILMRQKDMML